MKEPHRTASGAITESPLVLVDAFADEGLVGHGLLFTYTHLWPEISAQLLSSLPLAHWLEYADWWTAIVAEPLQIENGLAMPSSRAGSSVSWNEKAVNEYLA